MAKEITQSGVQTRAAVTVPSSRIPQAKPGSGTQRSNPIPVTPEQRRIMICEAAYHIAEHRGFGAGHDMDDWLAAEQQIDAALTKPALRAADSRLHR